MEKETFLVDNHLSRTIDIIDVNAALDASIKELLADKQILAWILKYSTNDFADCEIEDIIGWMDEPEVSKVRVEPGATNNEKANLLQNEDSVIGEGKILYDIRCTVWHNGVGVKYLINLEAQKSTSKGKLGYELDNRILFYMSRMISAQKDTEFTGSDYDDIKHIRSIWICMDAKDGEESITGIELAATPVYGSKYKMDNLDKFKGAVVRVRSRNNAEKPDNKLLAMLEELIRKEDANIKKQKLQDEFGLKMTRETEGRINTMCNWSEAIAEREREEGIEIGVKEGMKQTLDIIYMLKENASDDDIMSKIGCGIEVIEQVRNVTFA